ERGLPLLDIGRAQLADGPLAEVGVDHRAAPGAGAGCGLGAVVGLPGAPVFEVLLDGLLAEHGVDVGAGEQVVAYPGVEGFGVGLALERAGPLVAIGVDIADPPGDLAGGGALAALNMAHAALPAVAWVIGLVVSGGRLAALTASRRASVPVGERAVWATSAEKCPDRQLLTKGTGAGRWWNRHQRPSAQCARCSSAGAALARARRTRLASSMVRFCMRVRSVSIS